LQLDTIVDTAREASDTIAERMRALDGVPDGRSDTVVATTTVPAIPSGLISASETVDMITTRIYAVVGTLRAVHDDVDDADPSSADILHAIIDNLEKAAWLLRAENGTVH
jgi:starvation-inducible DNA-binding protein